MGVSETTIAREWAADMRENPRNAVSVTGIFILQIRLQHLLEVEIVPSVLQNEDADRAEPPAGDGLSGGWRAAFCKFPISLRDLLT